MRARSTDSRIASRGSRSRRGPGRGRGRKSGTICRGSPADARHDASDQSSIRLERFERQIRVEQQRRAEHAVHEHAVARRADVMP